MNVTHEYIGGVLDTVGCFYKHRKKYLYFKFGGNKPVSIYLQQYLNLHLNIIVNKYGETYYVNDINSMKNLILFMKEHCIRRDYENGNV